MSFTNACSCRPHARTMLCGTVLHASWPGRKNLSPPVAAMHGVKGVNSMTNAHVTDWTDLSALRHLQEVVQISSTCTKPCL